jgi:murein DD-endopeptidase MepM/ murein hydrolase activator NlpD
MKLRLQMRRDYDKKLQALNQKLLRKKNRRHLIDEMTYVKWQRDTKRRRGVTTGGTSFSMWIQETDYKLCWFQCAVQYWTDLFAVAFRNFTKGIRRYSLRTAIVGCGVLLAMLVIFLPQVGSGYAVYLNGSEVGTVRDTNTFEVALKTVENDMTEWLDIGDLYYEQTVVYTKAPFNFSNDALNLEECKKAVYELGFNKLYVKGVVILVDGQELACVGSKEDGEAVLNALTLQYTATKENETLIGEAEIDQTIEYEERIIDMSMVETPDSVVASIFGEDAIGQNAAMNTNVAASLAMRAEGSASDDEDVMSALSFDKEKFMTESSLSNRPAVTITTKKQVTYTQEIPYGVEFESTSTLYEGQKKVKTAGIPGEQTITSEITYVNGKQVEEVQLSSEITKEPVAEVQYIGTLALPAAQSTGRFLFPTSGVVSSYDERGGSHANGVAVDIANSVGTPIYASDSGVVIMTQWNAGYGMCIKIRHENGYSTLYGHLSSYGVSVGDEVKQGQYIGAMGNTGNSTGSHLHFEIRYNDVPVPLYSYFEFLAYGRRVTALQ